MVSEKQAEAAKLEQELVDLGFPNVRKGDTRARIELLGTTASTLGSWLRADRRIPDMAWHLLELYRQSPAEQRMNYLRWARERYAAKL